MITADAWAEPVPEDNFGMPCNCSTPTPDRRTGRRSTCSFDVKSSSNLPSHWTVKELLRKIWTADCSIWWLCCLPWLVEWKFSLCSKCSRHVQGCMPPRWWFPWRNFGSIQSRRKTRTQNIDSGSFECICFIVAVSVTGFLSFTFIITLISYFCSTWWGISVQNYLASTGCQLLLWSPYIVACNCDT